MFEFLCSKGDFFRLQKESSGKIFESDAKDDDGSDAKDNDGGGGVESKFLRCEEKCPER